MEREYVKFELDGKTYVGELSYEDEDGMCSVFCMGEEYVVPADILEEAEPYIVSVEDIKGFVRFEKSLEDIAPHEYFAAEYPYEVTKEDILACIENIDPDDESIDLFEDWGQHILGNENIVFEEDEYGIEGLRDLFDWVAELVHSEQYSLDTALYLCEEGVRNLYLPLSERAFEEEEMEEFIDFWNSEGLGKLPREGRKLYREFADELSEMRNEVGIRAVAYGCYGGNEAFDEDWARSEECLLDLVSEYDDVFAANSLGYIYYYGRTNGGVPMYDEAFRYFTLGHTGGVIESTYKLADMIYQGKGVVKNVNRYFSMLTDLEIATREHLYLGAFGNKFADVALRLGGYWLNERDDKVKAHEYYLLADFAIKRRMKTADYYGDRKVKAAILGELVKLREAVPEDNYYTVWNNIQNNIMFGGVCGYVMKVTKGVSKGEYHISLIPREGKMLLVLPEYGYCGFQERYEITAYGDESMQTGSFEFEAAFEGRCYFDGEEVYDFRFDEYVNVEPSRGKQIYAAEIGENVYCCREHEPNTMEVFQDEVAYEDYLE